MRINWRQRGNDLLSPADARQRVPTGCWRSQLAFTMVEIAIAIGVIGFALVAIIGILPTGLNVQKDNREETIINQDGPYLLNAIRRGSKGLDYLTNHVESVVIAHYIFDEGSSNWVWDARTTTNYINDCTNYYVAAQEPNGKWWIDGKMTNGIEVVRRLSMPRFRANVTNHLWYVVARVRALTGSALEQGSANSQVAFTYYLRPEIVPFGVSADPILPADFEPPFPNEIGNNRASPAVAKWAAEQTNHVVFTNSPDSNLWEHAEAAARWHQVRELSANAYEIRLRFNWPALPNGQVGPGRKEIRSLLSAIWDGESGFFRAQHYTE